MDVTLTQLACFLAVARTGHFTKAAREVHLAQPSLSRQILALEKSLGANLFHRARGNIALTAAGEALLPLATRMLADEELAHREVAELTGLRRGRVRFGAPPSLCVSLVADLLGRYLAAYPGIELHLTECGSHGLVDALTGGSLDAALIVSNEDRGESSLEVTPLLREDLVVVSAAAGEPLTRRRTLSLAELADHPLVMFHRGYDLRAATDAAFRQAGLVPRIVVEGAEMDAVLRFVECGLGVAVVPSLVVFHKPGLRAVRLDEPQLYRTISLAKRADVAPTRAARAMQEMLLSVVDEMSFGDLQGLARW
ncbi:LysR family transcriptional regulator [Rhodococcus kronopolitis]|uniref:LysR family transcriptional regulator n=1 Tax=Rhodococcus kronopolitis TaxID=1460226 RepID=A0ABV9FUY8_9NOCA